MEIRRPFRHRRRWKETPAAARFAGEQEDNQKIPAGPVMGLYNTASPVPSPFWAVKHDPFGPTQMKPIFHRLKPILMGKPITNSRLPNDGPG